MAQKSNKRTGNHDTNKRISKFLSLVLRHQPESIGIALDDSGWVEVDLLLDAANRKGKKISRVQLDRVVAESDKQRFALSEDGKRIRANQGHSVEVELGHPAEKPPEFLLHGTPEHFVESIQENGIKKAKRHDVHLHADLKVAQAVGKRRGAPVVLRIRSGDMHNAGHVFYLTPNSVWLVDFVPPEFVEAPE